MFNNLGIKHKLMLGFGAMVAIILGLLGLSYQNFARLSDASAWDRHTLEVLLEANQIETAILQVQTSTRGFMLTGNETLVAPIADEEQAAFKHIDKVLSLTSDNAAQQERIKKVA